MQKQITIVTFVKLCAGLINTTSNTYKTETYSSPVEARDAINEYLKKERKALDTNEPYWPVVSVDSSNDMIDDMLKKKEGTFAMELLTNRYFFFYKTVPAVYDASGDELYSALDGFLNSSRGSNEYKALAETVTRKMHRHTQSSLWRLIKTVIHALATAGYDERNQTAHNQAETLDSIIETF